MKSMVWFAVVVSCGLVGAAVVTAQEAPDARPIRFGVGAQVDYTDNRDSAPSGQEEDTFDFFVKPSLKAVFDWEQTALELAYEPAYRYRTNPSRIQNENEWFHDLSAALRHRFTPRVQGRLIERFFFTDDPAVDEGGTTVRRDSSFMLNRLTAGLSVATTPLSMADVYGHYVVKRYDDSVRADESDEDRYVAGASYRQWLTRTLNVSAAFEYERFDSNNSLGVDRDFDMLTGKVGVEQLFGADLRGDLQVGWQTLSYASGDLGDENSPFVQAGLLARLSPVLRLMANANYSLRSAYAFPFSSQQHFHIHSRMEWDASPRLLCAVSGEYRIEEYSSDSVSASTPASAFPKATSGDEVTLAAAGEVTWKLDHDLALKLRHLYEDVDSDVFVTYTRNATSLALTKQF